MVCCKTYRFVLSVVVRVFVKETNKGNEMNGCDLVSEQSDYDSLESYQLLMDF